MDIHREGDLCAQAAMYACMVVYGESLQWQNAAATAAAAAVAMSETYLLLQLLPRMLLLSLQLLPTSILTCWACKLRSSSTPLIV